MRFYYRIFVFGQEEIDKQSLISHFSSGLVS